MFVCVKLCHTASHGVINNEKKVLEETCLFEIYTIEYVTSCDVYRY